MHRPVSHRKVIEGPVEGRRDSYMAICVIIGVFTPASARR